MRDLRHGTRFYESQAAGLGRHFFDSVMGDIRSLRLHAGVHATPIAPFHRALAKRFPFAVYYLIAERQGTNLRGPGLPQGP